MKRKCILIFLIALAMGMTACSSESKGDSVSVETDFWQETDREETADTKTTETETNDVELPKPEITEENRKASPEDEETQCAIPLPELLKSMKVTQSQSKTRMMTCSIIFPRRMPRYWKGFLRRVLRKQKGNPRLPWAIK